MIIQHVLKGVNGITASEAQDILRKTGILSNWWRSVGRITPEGIREKLTDRNLDWHINHYNRVDPATGEPFYKHTPFISTTAGTVERDVSGAKNVVMPALITALEFATATYSTTGYIFYGYVYTLGTKAVELQEFGESIRDMLIYTQYMQYYQEGEVVAKVHLPSVNIEKVEQYDGPRAHSDLANGSQPAPSMVWTNPGYIAPDDFSNVRQAL